MDILTYLRTNLDSIDETLLPESKHRLAAVLVPIFSKDLSLLLTKRTLKVTHHRGQISFPGGRFMEKDKNLITTALRETEEETGISNNDVQIIGKLSPTVATSGHFVIPYVGIIENDVKIKIQEDEVEEYFFAKIHDLLQPSNLKKGRFYGMKLPYYQVSNYKIWGLTFRFITDLLQRIRE